jgi:neutral ceramidase
MKSIMRGFVLFAGLVLGLILLPACRHERTQSDSPDLLRLGAAELDITPPVGYRMAGYFDERLSTGVHDRLKAKALVLQQGREQIALVFCDLLGLSLKVSTNARAFASRQTGIPVAHIVISATHSHTGPLFDDVRRDYFHQAAVAAQGTDPQETIDYPAFLIERLVKVIVTAQKNARVAQLEAGITRQENLAFNRRYWMKDGKVVFNPGQLNPNIVRPAGPTDPDVAILLAREHGAKEPYAGVTIFAMHSDTVGGTLFSADYEYYVEQTLRRALGSNYISAFGLGTCGDLNHIDVSRQEPVTGFEVAERLGRTLGQTVLEAVPRLTVIEHPMLTTRSKSLQAALQEASPQQIAEARAMLDRLADSKTDFYTRVSTVKVLDLAQRGSSWPMEVQVIRFDADTALVCLPGEIFVELGLSIKRASPFRRTLVMSVCNDRPSYVPTLKAFQEGSYEITNSRVKPGVGEELVKTAVKMLNQLKE